ncbi:carboxylate-amine ligase [Pseudoxanthomonas sp. PXM01]|uniref:carboxylate-amine ligase n=1 Tax=Pseudoxanthomonas sp. PXM01 TaxID=2769295 RepID=UPI00177FE858|nr:carboxylate-amine ligase [Pseudoxanthomonas sp. PXM01]MBD9469531.1 carboxylate-amine ligase [Pseudoxanthomonas sp. PXM01]
MATDRDAHPYTFGLEEEYFLVRRNGRRLRHMPRRFFSDCREALGERFGSEMLQTQVEVQTGVHDDTRAAETDLRTLRRTVGEIAHRHGLGILSAGTHPSAQWRGQRSTDKPHYDQVMGELQMLGQRNLLCGLHVHVQPADPGQRVALMARMQPFLPLLLALSTSSPFWMGHATGLMGYRQTAYQEIPRTGLPPLFRNQAEYDHYVQRMVDGRAIKDASFLWWALRPSLAFPTLELRVTDACTDLCDALAIAQIYRCLVRHLERRPTLYADLQAGDQAIVAENLWRAQRYGFDAGLIDLGSRRLVSVREMLENTLEALDDDIRALDCTLQVERVWKILENGTSAHGQLERYRACRQAGESHADALSQVVQWLADASVVA